MCAEEERLPYERPPLSKEFLAGKKSLDDFTVHDSAWYRENEIDLRLGTRVRSVARTAHTVELPDNASLEYAKPLLATGSLF